MLIVSAALSAPLQVVVVATVTHPAASAAPGVNADRTKAPPPTVDATSDEDVRRPIRRRAVIERNMLFSPSAKLGSTPTRRECGSFAEPYGLFSCAAGKSEARSCRFPRAIHSPLHAAIPCVATGG